jgi:BCD family chlorophyll transporter-like MFS transporter
MLNAMVAAGTICGFAIAARLLDGRGDPLRVAACGLLAGIVALSAVVFSAPLHSPGLFRIGALILGTGTGLFSVGTLTAAMRLVHDGAGGRVLGAWGAASATATGVAVASSGIIRDGVVAVATTGALGPAMSGPASGYMVVYHIELALLFAAIAAIGPLVQLSPDHINLRNRGETRFGLAETPG